jgi:hypothetical protein
MPPASKKRKRDTPGEGRAAKIVRPGSSASSNEEDLGKVDLVDLSTVDNDEQYNDFKAKEEALKAKEQADLIKAQNQAEANKPVKLAEFQCIICMDNPTDLTVTHCGMFSESKILNIANTFKVTSSALNACTLLSMLATRNVALFVEQPSVLK